MREPVCRPIAHAWAAVDTPIELTDSLSLATIWLVRYLADQVAVTYLGVIVEFAPPTGTSAALEREP